MRRMAARVHFFPAHKKFLVLLCMCVCLCVRTYRKNKTTLHRVYVSACQWETGHDNLSFFSFWTDVHIQRGTISLYVVTVQYIYSLAIHLTATKACRLTGLPAATLNEELDPASCVCVQVGMCLHTCECVSMSVHVCLPGCVGKSTHWALTGVQLLLRDRQQHWNSMGGGGCKGGEREAVRERWWGEEGEAP